MIGEIRILKMDDWMIFLTNQQKFRKVFDDGDWMIFK